MRNKQFTYETAGTDSEHPYFRDLITNSDEFNFDMDDIANLRVEMKQLIRNLSSAYLEIKENEAAQCKERKRWEKETGQAKATTTAKTEKGLSQVESGIHEAAVDDDEEKKASDTEKSTSGVGHDGVLV